MESSSNLADKERTKTQQYASAILSSFGIIVILYYIIFHAIRNIGLSENSDFPFLHIGSMIVFAMPFFITSFIKRSSIIIKTLQVVFLIMISSLAVIDNGHTSIYGAGWWTVTTLLMYKYGFFEKRSLLKALIFFSIYISEAMISSILNNSINEGFFSIIFIFCATIIIYIIYKPEIQNISFSNKSITLNIQDYEIEKKQLINRLNKNYKKLAELEEYLTIELYNKKPHDLSKYKLTESELNIIKILVVEQSSNKQLSEKLNISEWTVKKHIYNIFNKIGIDRRSQLIDLCRYNF